MAAIDVLLDRAVQAGASNIHFCTGAPPFMRLHGDLVRMTDDIVTFDMSKTLIVELLNESQKDIVLKSCKEVDFSYMSTKNQRFRVNVYRQRRGLDASFHVIPSRIPSLRELGLPEIVKDMCKLNQGLILVTGSSGTGKTSTLAAMIDLINRTQKKHIITLEDPIEFVHENNLCMVNQREIGYHCKGFATTLRQALRQDPDIILVGEMRDLETISMAITAAETGHLVLGTLHTLSASKTLDRIIDVFPGHQRNQIRTMVSESIRCIVCQNLLKSPDGKSRVLACEVLIGIASISAQIRDAKTFQIPSILQMSHSSGMHLMDEDLVRLLKENLVSYDEALLAAHDPKYFIDACKKANIGPDAVQVDGKSRSKRSSPRNWILQKRG
jgi:twitching motility protein PilT